MERMYTIHSRTSSPPRIRSRMHDEIVETLGKNYHRTLKIFQDWDSSDVLNQYLESLARAYDPHSDYQGPDDYEDFAMQMNLSLVRHRRAAPVRGWLLQD